MSIKCRFNVDVMGCIVHIIICDDISRSINYHLKKHNKTTVSGKFAGYCLNPNNKSIKRYYVFISSDSLSHDTVNHEKSHLTEFILTDRDMPLEGEIRAYLDGFLSKKIHQFFKRRKIKLPK